MKDGHDKHIEEQDLENEILTTAALRFRGYEYLEYLKQDFNQFLKLFEATGKIPNDPLLRLTLFFLLQRQLLGFGSGYGSENCKFWWAFRELFLLTRSVDIPEKYRDTTYDEQWNRSHAEDVDTYTEFIKKRHFSTLNN